MSPRHLVLAVLLFSWARATLAQTAPKPIPLPEAPVRVAIPDVAAFDAVLTGAFRKVLTGAPEEGDPVVSAWRQSRIGSKLEDQWGRLSEDLPWTWDTLRALKARSIGIALLEVGHLEAVMVVDTPLAVLPTPLPPGTAKTHGGIAYGLVAAGHGDSLDDPDRRMGLAWARSGGHLFLATSEGALLLALDAALAGRGFAPTLPGLVSLELDLAALRKDRYFRREFVFGDGPEEGTVRAALRVEAGEIVEVREGAGEPRGPGSTFEAPGAAAAGWDADGDGLAHALRAALLEPIPLPLERPLVAIAPLPGAAMREGADRYLVSLERPLATANAPQWEEGEQADWRELLKKQRVTGWGYLVDPDGKRRLVFPWPASQDDALVELCRRTVERRAGRATVAAAGESREIRVGPGLPAAALRRTGAYLWAGISARDLGSVPTPRPATDVVRWARLDLAAVRAEGPRWQKAEGPAQPEEVRPLSDRILGLLGWMPATTSVSVERRKTPNGWSERVVFGTSRP